MTEIYYYSGTGFTLEAARRCAEELRKTEEVCLVPIVSVLNHPKKQSPARKIGLFMPMHSFGMPEAFIRFLKEQRFPNAHYIFALITRGGAPTRIYNEINRHLKKQHKRLAAFGYATAPNTFEIIYKVKLDSMVLNEQKNFDRDIDNFARQIAANAPGIHRGFRNRWVENFLFPLIRILNRGTKYYNLQKDFFSSDHCIGCGRCEKICLASKIQLHNGKPIWQSDVNCQFCLACIQFCPVQAIQIKHSQTFNRSRIFNPRITWEEIAAQKQTVD